MKTIRAIAILAVCATASCNVLPPAPEKVAATGATPLAVRSTAFTQEYTSSLCIKSSGCTVIVTVRNNCVISTDPYTLGMPEGFTNTVITWQIDNRSSSAVVFTRDGVTFKSPGAQQEFVNPVPGTTTYQYTDKNPHIPTNARRPYHYTVKVTQGGSDCPAYDPTVVNDY